MLTYPEATIVIKEGSKFGTNNILYLTLTDLLDDDYMKTAIYDRLVGGSLIIPDLLYLEWEKEYSQIWDDNSIVELALFSNDDIYNLIVGELNDLFRILENGPYFIDPEKYSGITINY